MSALERYARVCARHAGLAEAGLAEELERRRRRLEPWARIYAELSAWAALRLAPLLLLGRPRRLESLDEDRREEVLGRLVRCAPLLRMLFLGARTLTLGALYGRRE